MNNPIFTNNGDLLTVAALQFFSSRQSRSLSDACYITRLYDIYVHSFSIWEAISN